MSLFKSYRFYQKEEIEKLACEILMRMEKTPQYKLKWPLDPSRVAEFLGLDIDYLNLPRGTAAAIWPTEGKIVVNENNQESSEGFENSSIAHEIGHWVLHVNQDEAKKNIPQTDLPWDNVTQQEIFLSRTRKEQKIHGTPNQTEDNRQEWQAQYFASCLLMPRHVLEDKRRGRDLTNWKHLYAMADELGVTISNLTHRLQDLQWIDIPKNSKRIYPGKMLPPT